MRTIAQIFVVFSEKLNFSNVKTKLDILSNSCGPLKMSELYMDAPLTRIGKGHASVTARLAE